METTTTALRAICCLNKFFPFDQITVIDDIVVVVVSSARPDRDDGEVGHRQNLWVESTLAKHQDKLKIVNDEFVDFADIVKMREVLQASDISN